MSKPEQAETPILKGLREYHRAKMTPFTVPGHKLGKGVDSSVLKELGTETFANDIPLLIGIDDRTGSHKIKEKAQELAAKAYGADKCFFSTNGTSLSVHAALLAVAEPGDKVLVPRNLHHSMVAALIISGVIPVILEPEYDPVLDVFHGVAPDTLKKTLADHADAKAVCVVSPDYYGICANLKELAKITHEHGMPFIVDEAWGPHFVFHEKLPASGVQCGADLTMGSVHKTVTALSQASVFLLHGSRIPEARFQKSFDLFETTSPSSLILASLDGARSQMALHGEKLWGNALELAAGARESLKKIHGLRVTGREALGSAGMFDIDETKIVMDLKELGVSGYEAGDWLWSEMHVAMELADHRRLMALITLGDDEESISQLVKAIDKMCGWARSRSKKSLPILPPEDLLRPEQVLPPREAYFGPSRPVNIEECVGMIAAEMVSPYPPGVPRVVPGQKITQPLVDYLIGARDAGMYQEDSADEKLKTILVVD
jgi:arginine decarboxylase